MKQLYCTILFLVILTVPAFAQPGITDKINTEEDKDRGPSINAMEREASRLYKEGDYFSAMQLYQRALVGDTLNNPQSLEGYANAAYAFHAMDQAEWGYRTMLQFNMDRSDRSVLLRYADVLYRKGEYLEAKKQYHKYLFETPPPSPDPQKMAFAEERHELCDWAITLLNEKDMQILTWPMDTLINTPYSEYSPEYHNGKLYFSSYRFPYEKDREKPKRHLIKIMVADDLNSATGPVVETLPINAENKLTAHATFTSDGQRMYYCKCTYEATALYRCDIYSRELDGDKWGAEKRLPEQINIADYTNTEPAVGKLSDGREALFFVSDRPGKGGRDIWYSIIKDDEYSDPVNLSTVNTAEDDVTPFFHENTQTLYFSTIGLPSLGGFDVYKTEYTGSNWTMPRHMGAELNTHANDVYFSLTPSGRTGLIASNREGAINYSEEACCYDLFKVDLIKPEMIAINFNKLTGDSLSVTTMRLLTLENGVKTEEIKLEVDPPLQAFKLLPGRDYMLITDKPKFISDTVRFSTPRMIWEERIVKKLYLEPQGVQLIVTVYDEKTKVPLDSTTAQLDHMAMLSPSGALQTGKGGAPLDSEKRSNLKGNRYEYFLDFNNTYDISATKLGYTTDFDSVSTMGMTKNAVIERQLYLTQGIDFVATVIDKNSRKPINNVNFKLIDVTRNTTDRHTSPENRNDYNSVLNYERRYRIEATKEGYSSDSREFSTIDLPKDTAFQRITKQLELYSTNLEDYLPITLYFDNDQPRYSQSWMDETVTKEYFDTYTDYFKRKKRFVDKYTRNMTTANAVNDSIEIVEFFDDTLRAAGWQELFTFSEALYDMLEAGDSIEIRLKGYASPLAGSEYNYYLTKRRVASVFNHFRIFDGEIFSKHLYPEFGGIAYKSDKHPNPTNRLIIISEPFGSTKAPPNVSKNPKDVRESVYSIPASLERRVEVIGVTVKKRNQPNQ
jgi:tetratricopeptide (TPR) repeat protein